MTPRPAIGAALVAVTSVLGACGGGGAAPGSSTTLVELPVPTQVVTGIRPALATPEAAGRELWDAWRDGDRDRALGFSPPKVVRLLFADQWTPQYSYDGCDPVPSPRSTDGAAAGTSNTAVATSTTATTAPSSVPDPEAAPPSSEGQTGGSEPEATVFETATGDAPDSVRAASAEHRNGTVVTVSCRYLTVSAGYTVRVTGSEASGYRVTRLDRGVSQVRDDSPTVPEPSDTSQPSDTLDPAADLDPSLLDDTTVPSEPDVANDPGGTTAASPGKTKVRKKRPTTTIAKKAKKAATKTGPTPAPAPAPAREPDRPPATASNKVEVGNKPVEVVTSDG